MSRRTNAQTLANEPLANEPANSISADPSTPKPREHDGSLVNATMFVEIYMREYRENERATWVTLSDRIKAETGHTMPGRVCASRASSYRLIHRKSAGKSGLDLPKLRGTPDSGGRGPSINWQQLQGLAKGG